MQNIAKEPGKSGRTKCLGILGETLKWKKTKIQSN